jgi:hypothetical protein
MFLKLKTLHTKDVLFEPKVTTGRSSSSLDIIVLFIIRYVRETSCFSENNYTYRISVLLNFLKISELFISGSFKNDSKLCGIIKI